MYITADDIKNEISLYYPIDNRGGCSSKNDRFQKYFCDWVSGNVSGPHPFLSRERPPAITFPILVDIGSWEEIYRKISYFQNLLCKFVKLASIYGTKSFQFLKQFGWPKHHCS